MIRPAVLLFDVNETLLDIEALAPLFARLFGDRQVLREWYAQLVVYSQAAALTGRYVPFGVLGAGVLKMLGAIHGRSIDGAAVEELAAATASLPAHAGAADGLVMLREAGYRLATLTNSAPTTGPAPLERAGLAPFFEASFSVDAVRRFKPALECYHYAATALAAPPDAICMVAAHVWDLLGAEAAGFRTALVTWGANAPLPVDGLPQPDICASTMVTLAEAIKRRWP